MVDWQTATTPPSPTGQGQDGGYATAVHAEGRAVSDRESRVGDVTIDQHGRGTVPRRSGRMGQRGGLRCVRKCLSRLFRCGRTTQGRRRGDGDAGCSCSRDWLAGGGAAGESAGCFLAGTRTPPAAPALPPLPPASAAAVERGDRARASETGAGGRRRGRPSRRITRITRRATAIGRVACFSREPASGSPLTGRIGRKTSRRCTGRAAGRPSSPPERRTRLAGRARRRRCPTPPRPDDRRAGHSACCTHAARDARIARGSGDQRAARRARGPSGAVRGTRWPAGLAAVSVAESKTNSVVVAVVVVAGRRRPPAPPLSRRPPRTDESRRRGAFPRADWPQRRTHDLRAAT